MCRRYKTLYLSLCRRYIFPVSRTALVCGWLKVETTNKMIVSRSQQHHLMRRVTEERKWLHLTVAIIAGFTVSVVPVFVCYILWVSHVRTPPYVGEVNFDYHKTRMKCRSRLSAPMI